MLPGALLQESGTKRTARDWIVDVIMFLIAIGVGVFVYSESEDVHSDARGFRRLHARVGRA